MRQVQADHEHAQKGGVLAVEKGMGVDTRMKQKQEHRQHREQPVAKQPIRKQIAEKTTCEKEQMRDQMAHQINIAAVLQPQSELYQRQRQLESHAVKPGVVVMEKDFVMA